jgi:hypothetical protein
VEDSTSKLGRVETTNWLDSSLLETEREREREREREGENRIPVWMYIVSGNEHAATNLYGIPMLDKPRTRVAHIAEINRTSEGMEVQFLLLCPISYATIGRGLYPSAIGKESVPNVNILETLLRIHEEPSVNVPPIW